MVFVQTRLLFNMWPPVHRVSNGSKCTTNNNCTKPKHLHSVSKCSPNNTITIAQNRNGHNVSSVGLSVVCLSSHQTTTQPQLHKTKTAKNAKDEESKSQNEKCKIFRTELFNMWPLPHPACE